MNNKRRALAWAGGSAVALIGTAGGALLFKAGLEDADRWSSVIAMSVTTLIGLPLSLYQAALARRAWTSGASTSEVHVTAGGDRSIAAQNLQSASTGNGSLPAPETTSSTPRFAPEDQSAHRPDAAPPDPRFHVRIEAVGERSIAAQNIGSASTGDSVSPSTGGPSA